MGKQTYDRLREPKGIPKSLGLKSFQKLPTLNKKCVVAIENPKVGGGG
jgi:hypothetical protein